MRKRDPRVERLYTAIDMWATGVALQREALRRRHPDASSAELEALLNRWLQERPGAEHGDGPQPANP